MIELILGLAVGAALAGVVIFLWYKKISQQKQILHSKEEEKQESFLMLQNQLRELRQRLDNQFGQSNEIVQKVTKKLTQLEETNKQVVGFAQQLQSLEDILKNPKQRGILGEFFLEELLKNVLPPKSYQLQYKFKNGQIADAVIFVMDNKIIPIDSKFSLDNYNRLIKEKNFDKRKKLEKQFKNDLKKRIDETAKYINPQENTLNFALMFIPAETIYYDLLVNKVGAVKCNTRDLLEYAGKEKKVHIVSPNSFYAFLQTIVHGLRAFQIEKSTIEIRKNVEKLARHLTSYESYLQKLGNHLSATVNMYNKAYHEFAKIDKDVARVTEKEKSVEPLKIKKPQ